MHIVPVFYSILLLAFAASPDDKYDPTTLVFPPKLHVWMQKATAMHLRLYTGNRVKVDDPQGVAATRLDAWENANRKDDDDELTVYGVNAGQNMVIYNSSKAAISFYGMSQRGEQELHRPSGITAHQGGDVYVADTGNDRVVHLYNSGKQLSYVRALRDFKRPSDVAMTAGLTLYVADTGNNRVVICRNDSIIQVWSGGLVQQPSAIAATDESEQWAYRREAFVVVVDSLAKRVQKFAPDSRRLGRTTAAEFGKSNAQLGYIALDYYNNVYITDHANHCVHKFDRNLTYLTSFGREGSGDKEFHDPRGIAIYRRFGQVIIAEERAVQYYWVGADVREARAALVAADGLVRFEYFLTEPSFATLEIVDHKNKVLARPMAQTLRFSGAHREHFDRNWQPVFWRPPETDTTSVKAVNAIGSFSPGKYELRLTIEPTYSSYKRFKKTVTTSFEIR